LFWGKSTLGVLPCEQALQYLSQYNLAPSPLVHVVGHLRNREQVIAIDFLLRLYTNCLPLFVPDFIYARCERNQQIPREPISMTISQNQPFSLEFRD
jgi:hypothetical protein